MGKSKGRGHSEVEHLRGLVRSLKSENRYLRKKLNQFENQVDNIEDEEEYEETISLDVCPKCQTGIMTETDFKYIIIRKCSTCGLTERKKKV